MACAETDDCGVEELCADGECVLGGSCTGPRHYNDIAPGLQAIELEFRLCSGPEPDVDCQVLDSDRSAIHRFNEATGFGLADTFFWQQGGLFAPGTLDPGQYWLEAIFDGTDELEISVFVVDCS